MIKTLAVSAALLAASLGTANAATVFADNFNSSAQGTSRGPNGWTVSDGTVDVIGTGYFDRYPGNGNYLDMDGSTRNAGRITSNTATSFVIGRIYTLSFSYGKNGNKAESMLFGFGGLNALLELKSGNIPRLLTHTVSFTAISTSGALYFEGVGGDNEGVILDNVLLTAVPLPAAAPMLLVGLGGLAMLRRRRSV